MAKKNLFLLTKTFPFAKDEHYIARELVYLQHYFTRIFIYPNDYYGPGDTHDKELPPNVEVVNLNRSISGTGTKKSLTDVLFLLKWTISELLNTDDQRSFFKNFKWNLINFWTQLRLSQHFYSFLQKKGISPEDTVFYSYWFHKSALMLSVLKAQKKIPSFISRAHSIDLYHQEWGMVNENSKVPSYKMFKLKHTSRIFCVSKHGQAFLQSRFPRYASKVSTSYLGVLETKPSPGRVKDPAFMILTCSNVNENKRVHKLAEALAHIKAEVKWVHFGTGPLFHLLETFATSAPPNIRVELKGLKHNSEITRFYEEHRVDLLVNLSRVEGLPVSIMEALSAGVPVLAAAIYGVPEAVIEGRNGFLLDVNFSIEELVSKLNHAIHNKELLEKMSRESLEIHRTGFNAETNYNGFAQTLLLNP